MKEATLLRIALVVSIVGIAGLFIVSQKLSVDDAVIGKLDGLVDEDVIISGTVLDVSSIEGTTFVRLQKEEITTVVLFGEVPVVEIGDYVQVRGTVSEKDGAVGVIGKEMRVV